MSSSKADLKDEATHTVSLSALTLSNSLFEPVFVPEEDSTFIRGRIPCPSAFYSAPHALDASVSIIENRKGFRLSAEAFECEITR